MTGEEFYELSMGATVYVIAPFYNFKVGDTLRVEYIPSSRNQLYVRDPKRKIGSQISMINIYDALNNLGINGICKENKNIIHLPFTVGDKVWFIHCNQACLGEIDSYHIDYNAMTKNIYIKYFIYSPKTEVPSSKCFSTKEELLKSL